MNVRVSVQLTQINFRSKAKNARIPLNRELPEIFARTPLP